jgi:hypothetical protein
MRFLGMIAVGVVLAGCGRSGGGGSDACEDKCVECGGSETSCANTCAVVEVQSEDVGCSSEHSALLSCWSENDRVCGEALAFVCDDEEDALAECARDFCADDPTDEVCVDTCTGLCERLYDFCGVSTADCASQCAQIAATVEPIGCAREQQALLRCETEQGACSAEDSLARCRTANDAINACVQSFCAANPSDPVCS